MITSRKSFFAKLSRLLKTESLFKIGSRAFFYFLRLFIKIKNRDVLDLWYRNSLALSYFEPFVSDIDITVWCSSPSPILKENLQKQFSFLRRFFPFLGEVHLCTPALAQNIQTWLNPLELDRDPHLRGLLQKASLLPARPSQKILFLTKMLESNYQDLQTHPDLRERKWRYHFKQCQITAPDSPARILLTLLSHLASELHLHQEELTQSLQKITGGRELHLEFDEKIRAEIYALFFNRLCFLNCQNSLTKEAQELLLENLKWEACGLALALDIPSAPSLQGHLQRLRENSLPRLHGEFKIEAEKVLSFLEAHFKS